MVLGPALLHEPGAQPDGVAAVVAERRLDQLDGASRPEHAYGDLDRVDGERAEDVVGQPADEQPVDAPAVPVPLDLVRQQPERRRDVLLVDGPGATHLLGGREPLLVEPVEVGHAGGAAQPFASASVRAYSTRVVTAKPVPPAVTWP